MGDTGLGVLQGTGGRGGWRDMEAGGGTGHWWGHGTGRGHSGLEGSRARWEEGSTGEVAGAWRWAQGEVREGARSREGCRDSGRARGWEGARGAPGIPSAGSRHSLVLRMSRCDTSSDSARGRYFSTLRGAELSGAARTASFPPRSPSHRPPRTTAGSSRTAPPWHRARPRESGGSAGTARRGRGLGKKGRSLGNRGGERGNGVARRRWRESEGAGGRSSAGRGAAFGVGGAEAKRRAAGGAAPLCLCAAPSPLCFLGPSVQRSGTEVAAAPSSPCGSRGGSELTAVQEEQPG